ncbi:MAG: DEAD/DEAH box helicase [Cetobacterium sp.]
MSDSKLPTLLRRGYVVPPSSFNENQRNMLKNTVSIEYIMQFIEKITRSTPSKYDAKGKLAIGSKVIILKSDTGSGKSTVLPVYLFNSFPGKDIIVTQPRILNAVDIPLTIASINPDFVIEKNIGYITGPFKLRPIQKGIMFTTVGVLTQQLQQAQQKTFEQFVNRYSYIVIDEVHERDVQLDICLYLLKKMLNEFHMHINCPVIILMSATINEKLFINYFNVPSENYLQVKGSTFPIEMEFTDYSVKNYIYYASLKAQQLHLMNLSDIHGENSSNNRDIIIFVKDLGVGKSIYTDLHLFNAILASETEVEKYKESLPELISDLMKTVKGGSYVPDYVLPILLDTNSFTQSGREYKNLFTDIKLTKTEIWPLIYTKSDDSNNSSNINDTENKLYRTIDLSKNPKLVQPTRRIIISTNLAETGVTIPTLKYCIDTGFQINAEFFPEYGSPALLMKNIPLGSAIQRRGRVGRKAPGKFYACYTEKSFNTLEKTPVSNTINNDITELILNLLVTEKKTEITTELSVGKIKEVKINKLFQMFTSFSNEWYKVNNPFETKIADLDLIESPSIQSISYSFEKLHVLGFIDDNYDITSIGLMSLSIRYISVELKKFIFSGFYYGANILDLITITSFVQISKFKVFTKLFNIEKFAKNNKIKIKNVDGYLDEFNLCILVWNAIQSFIATKISKKYIKLNELKDWCLNNDILFDGISKVIDMRDTIVESLLTAGVNTFYNGLEMNGIDYDLMTFINTNPTIAISEIIKIKQCLYEGFKLNLLKYDKFSIYRACLNNISIKVKSQFMSEIKPKYVICSNYILSSKFNSMQYEFISDGFISSVEMLDIDPKFAFY